MEKAMYPSPYMRITQKHGIGSHVDSYAIDEAGSDGGIDFINAPFTGIVKRIYTKDANEVWLESIEPVLYADGTIDYMTIMVAHDNNVSNLKEGQIIKQGQRFYEEGTKGQASGNHIHLEVGKGKFTGTGWYKNKAGHYSINNGKKIDECLFIDDSYKILDTAGYNFKNVKSVVVEEETPNVEMVQAVVKELDKKNKELNKKLEKQNGELIANEVTIRNLNEELAALKQSNDKLEKIFTCTENCTCQFEMFKGEELFIR